MAGSKLLAFAIETAEKREVEEIYLHVQTNNDEALKFYEKFGFSIVNTIKDYYKRIEPRDCYVLQKALASGGGGGGGGKKVPEQDEQEKHHTKTQK